MDIKCPHCDTQLAKDYQGTYIEIKCRRCKAIVVASGNSVYLTSTPKPDKNK